MKVKLYTVLVFDKVADDWIRHEKCPFTWVQKLIDQYVDFNKSLDKPRFVNIKFY